jgi:hypothetical protein
MRVLGGNNIRCQRLCVLRAVCDVQGVLGQPIAVCAVYLLCHATQLVQVTYVMLAQLFDGPGLQSCCSAWCHKQHQSTVHQHLYLALCDAPCSLGITVDWQTPMPAIQCPLHFIF